MGILQDVLAYKEYQDRAETQAANAIPAAVNAFIQGRQQQQKNMIDMLQIDATLATKGLRRGLDGFVKDPMLQDPKDALEVENLRSQIDKRNTEQNFLNQFLGGTQATIGGKPQTSQDQQTSPTWKEIDVGGVKVVNPNYVEPLSEKDRFELEEKKAKKEKETTLVTDTAKELFRSVQEVKKGLKYFGVLGDLPSEAAPSSLAGERAERKNWETNVEKLLSGKIVELMTTMKSASQTGATGFGQLNKEELQQLKNASTALKRTLSPKDAEKYLNQIEKMQLKVFAGDGEVLQDAEGNYAIRRRDGTIEEF
jgi:hypothetical protein